MDRTDQDRATEEKGRHYPNLPPVLAGEDTDHYSNRLIGVYGDDQRPYDHVRNRQCALGWHNECSERSVAAASSRRCQCPCHECVTPDASPPLADVQRPTPPLTEEELAHIEHLWHKQGLVVKNAIPYLIADLRARSDRCSVLVEYIQRLEAEMERAGVALPDAP